MVEHPLASKHILLGKNKTCMTIFTTLSLWSQQILNLNYHVNTLNAENR